MRDWALAIHRDADMRDLIGDALEDELELPSAQVIKKANIEDATAALLRWGDRSCRLVVAGVTNPPSRKHSPPLDASDLTGLHLAGRLRERGNANLPFLFLVAFNDLERLKEEAKVANVNTIECGSELYKRLPHAIAEAVRPGSSAARGVPCVNVDISLRGMPPFEWHLKVREPRRVCDDTGALNIRRDELNKLLHLSVPASSEERDLGKVGTELYRLFMANDLKNAKLNIRLHEECGKLTSDRWAFRELELARIRFIVDADTHPILLETLARPAEGQRPPDFWMLKSPIFRKYEHRAEQYPLFKDRRSRSEPLDCLLIEGCSTPFLAPDPIARTLEAIPIVKDEISDMEDLLARLRREDPQLMIGEVKVLRHPGGKDGEAASQEFAAELKRTLETGVSRTRPWRLIHYAGHSAKGYDDQGYLVLGPGTAGLLNAEIFARWARRSQFVFLSSCQSADTYFVMQLVERTIPAVLGFRWPVMDAVARGFAAGFYRHLFQDEVGRRFLEYAFLKARRDLYGADPDSPDWASPILVMQMIDSERDDD
jgi:hypothetical protein